MSLRENDKTTNHIQCLSLFASFHYFYFHFDLIFKQLFSQQMGPITVSTPGKIILLGEHSVVYGNSAFASSLSDLRINITLVCSSVLTTVLDVIERNNKTPSYHDLPWFYKYKQQGRPEMVCILRSRLASSIVPRKGFIMYFFLESRICLDIKEKSEFLSTLMDTLHVSIPSTYSKTFLALCYLLNTYCSDFWYVDDVFTSYAHSQDQTLSCGYDFDIESHGLPFGAGLGSSASISCSLSLLVYLISKTYQDPSYDIQAESVSVFLFPLSIHRSSFLPRTLFWRTLCLLTSIAGRMSVNASSMALPQVWTILFVWWVWNESHASYWSPGHSLHFRKGQFEVKSCPSISLLIINTNVPKNTKEMVSKVRQLYTSFPSIIQPLFDSINEQIRYVLEVEQEVFYYSMYEWA